MAEPGDVVAGRWQLGELLAVEVYGRLAACRDVHCGGIHHHCPGCGAVTTRTGHGQDGCERARRDGRADEAWVVAYREGRG